MTPGAEVRGRVAAAWKALREHRVAAALAIASLSLFVLSQLFERWFDSYVITRLLAAITWLTQRPAGFFGVLLAGELAVLLGLAFVDTSPFVHWLQERRSPTPPKRSLEDRQEVERIVEIWNLGPAAACESAVSSLGAAMREFGDGSQPFASLLSAPRDRLHNARRAVEECLKAESAQRFDEVLTRLQELLEAYGACAMWYNRCRRLRPTFIGDGDPSHGADWHRRWASDHQRMYLAFDQLRRRSSWEGKRLNLFAARLSHVAGMMEDRLPPELLAMDDYSSDLHSGS